jgi:hypothetical protein
MSIQVAKQFQFRESHWYDTWHGWEDTRPVEAHELPGSMLNPNAEPWAYRILQGLNDWCGCYDMAPIAAHMAAYLRGEWGSYLNKGEIIHFSDDNMSQVLIALIADANGLTEHGGNVGGSWVTDAGKRWLELWDERMA